MKKIDYNLKLNIRSIVLYERLTGESFSLFDSSIEKIIPLLYCILVANNDFRSTFSDTVEYLFSDEKFLADLTKKLESLLLYESQFNNLKVNKESTDIVEDTESIIKEKSDPIFLSQLIPVLVSDCGLSIDYIMNEMHYTEIDDFIHYRDEKYKARMEEKRLFTYLTIAPNIDTKKVTVEKLLPFEWEKEKKKKEGHKTIERDRAKFEEFMNSGALKIDNNKNTNK